MRHVDRREFVTAALGGLGLLHAGPLHALARAADLADGGDADLAPGDAAPDAGRLQPTVRLRRNVYCMNATSPAIVAYAKAVTTMRARPASNPTSWTAQANIHGANAPVVGMLADQCEHGNTFFLSWHRMYLHHFERIVRAASGDANFALPYWGYGAASTSTRVLPAPFRLPADPDTNPLYATQRRATVNGGAALTASVVDAGSAMGNVAFGSFSSALEGTPHAQVHVAVGGWMSAFETAGLDPIFWLHHCNIDRIWELWLASGGGRVNPTSGPWTTQSFQFYTETGATVSMTGAQIVDTANQLSYRYARPLCILRQDDWWRQITIQRPIDPRLAVAIERVRRRPPLPQPRVLARAPQPLPLAAATAAVRLPVEGEARRILDTFDDDRSSGNQLNLVFEDLRLEQDPAVVYEVYVNLPSGEVPAVTSPHYVGNLNLFGPRRRDRALRQTLPILPAYLRLRALQRFRSDTVAVTIVPRGATEGEKPETLLRGRAQVTLGSVRLQVE